MSSINTPRKRSRVKLLPMLIMCVVLLMLYWVSALIVILTDPFDVYPWGKAAQLNPNNLTDDNKLLVSAVSKNSDIDLLMIGSSVAKPYSVADMRHAFPNLSYPFNFSYDGTRPFDRAKTLDLVVTNSDAEILIVWLDWTYAFPTDIMVRNFPDHIYDKSYYNDIRMVNYNGLMTSIRILQGRPMFDDVKQRMDKFRSLKKSQYLKFQSEKSQQKLNNNIVEFSPVIDRKGVQSCSELVSLKKALVDQLHIWDSRGKSSIVAIPAYSPTFYYYGAGPLTGVSLADQLMLRRCIVKLTENMSNVKIVALDSDHIITKDISNFSDPGHLFAKAALERSLSHIVGNDYVITNENVDEYIAKVKFEVIQLRNSSNYEGLSKP